MHLRHREAGTTLEKPVKQRQGIGQSEGKSVRRNNRNPVVGDT